MKKTYMKPAVDVAVIVADNMLQYTSVVLKNDEVSGENAESNGIDGHFSLWDDNFDEED